MFTITNEEFKKIVGEKTFSGWNDWEHFLKDKAIITELEIEPNFTGNMLKLTFSSHNKDFSKMHNGVCFFEDVEEKLKELEEILIFSAYEQKRKQNETKLGAFTFLIEREKELNDIFSIFNIKRTNYNDYLEKTSKDAYIKVEIHESLKLLKGLTGQHIPEDLVEKIKQEASKREDYKLTVYFTKCSSFEQDDRIIFTVLPNIFNRTLTIHGYQEAIEDILLEHSYKCNIIEKEELFERIDELNKVFKVKKDKKYFENKLDLVSENFLVCPKENFLRPLKFPQPGALMCGRAHGTPKVEITTFSPDFSFIWNQKPFDLAGYKFETMNEWEAYKSKKEVDEKFEQAENDGNKEKPKFEIGTFISPVMDNRGLKEIAEEIIKTIEFIKTIEGDKNNMNTNKNKPMRPDSIMIDEENKLVVVFLNNKKFTIKCHKDDKFDYRVGLGVAVSRLNENNKELQHLKQNMGWKAYYLYCFNKFFYFNEDKIKAFDNKVYAEKEQYKLKCNEEKVRKFKCEEVEMIPYKPKKISHNFIMF